MLRLLRPGGRRHLGLKSEALRAPFLGFGVPYYNIFFLKGALMNKSLYFFLLGYLKAQFKATM